MITYTLNDLIVFWHRIRGKKFNGIVEVLDVIDDDEVDDSQKREMILESLRHHGLYEIGYEGGEPIEEPEELYVPVDVFDLKLENVNVRVVILLN